MAGGGQFGELADDVQRCDAQLASVGRNSSSVKVRPAVSRKAAPPSAMPKRTWSATLSRSSQMAAARRRTEALARSMIGEQGRLEALDEEDVHGLAVGEQHVDHAVDQDAAAVRPAAAQVVVEHLLELRDGGAIAASRSASFEAKW